MKVNFKFDYVLNLHNRHSYINAIERDGMDDDTAFKKSLVQVSKQDIKSINKMSDGSATVIMKKSSAPLTTVEDYEEIIDAIHYSNMAVNMMYQKKIYIFDDFEVDNDELSVCEGLKSLSLNNKE